MYHKACMAHINAFAPIYLQAAICSASEPSLSRSDSFELWQDEERLLQHCAKFASGMVCMGTVGSWAVQYALLKAGKSIGNSHSSFIYAMSEQFRRASVPEACTSLVVDAS